MQVIICEVHPRISRHTPPLIPAFLLLRRGQMRLDLCKLSAFVAQIGFECELLTKPRSVGLALALARVFRVPVRFLTEFDFMFVRTCRNIGNA